MVKVNEPVLSSKPLHDWAYTWLFMKGDFYLPGVFTSVFSVARTMPNADLVVMVTDDVSQHARDMLLKVATHLCDIPYLSYESKQLKTERTRELYESWIASSYSKWNVLALPYKKIIQVDGDTIHTENTDELFDLEAPAMPLASPFVVPLGRLPSFYHGPVGRDGYPPHGTKIDPDVIDKILNVGGMLPTSTPAVIEPNLDDYVAYKQMVKDMEPFGFPECHSGFDEQSISYFYTTIKHKQFTAIHQRYNYYPWKDGFLFRGDVPRIIHFFSDTKPWAVDFDKYPDVITWYKMASLACKTTGIKPAGINISAVNTEAADAAEDEFIKNFINVTDVTEIYGMLK